MKRSLKAGSAIAALAVASALSVGIWNASGQTFYGAAVTIGNVLGLGTGIATALGLTPTGSGAVVLATSPALTTPSLGAATATTLNGLTVTSTSGGTLTVANSGSLIEAGAFAGTLTFTATTNDTLPSGTVTLAGLSNAQTFSAVETYTTGAALAMLNTASIKANSLLVGSASALTTCALGGAGTCSYTATAGSYTEKITMASATGSTTNITLTFPTAAASMYICDGYDSTTSTQRLLQTGGSTTTAVLTFYSLTGTAGYAGTAGDVLYVKCMAN